jgi:hypothetical protein
MIDKKWTPGPWVVDHDYPNDRTPGYANISGAIGQPEEHRALAKVVVELDGERYGQGEANAALIAAAPDLYAALELAIPLLMTHPNDVGIRRYDVARAALAKARGET